VVFNAILSQTPAPISRQRPGLPPKLEEIIDKALEKDRDMRYQHAADIRADLKRLKRERDSWPPGAGQTAKWTAAPISVSTKQSKSRRWMAWTLAVAAVAGGIAAIAWMWMRKAPSRTTPAEILPLNGLPGIAAYPALRPDGSQIAFAWDGYQHKNFNIYVQPASPGSGEPLALTSGAASDLSPAWSPDGTQIAFIRASPKPDESGVYVVPSSGGRERLLMLLHVARPATGLARQLAWCSDGSLFVTDHDAESEPFRIFRILNGSRQAVTEPPAGSFGDSDPACSPDATLLAFTRTEKSRNIEDVYIVSLQSPAKGSQKVAGVHSSILGLAWLHPKDLFLIPRRLAGLVDRRRGDWQNQSRNRTGGCCLSHQCLGDAGLRRGYSRLKYLGDGPRRQARSRQALSGNRVNRARRGSAGLAGRPHAGVCIGPRWDVRNLDRGRGRPQHHAPDQLQ
jgi:hypothetical protein